MQGSESFTWPHNPNPHRADSSFTKALGAAKTVLDQKYHRGDLSQYRWRSHSTSSTGRLKE